MASSSGERGFLPLYLLVLGVLAALVAAFILLTQHYG